MDFDKEIQLMELAKKLDAINRRINDQRRELGKEDDGLRSILFTLIEEIKTVLCNSYPIDKIVDSKSREILKKVRDGYYFAYDDQWKTTLSGFKRLEAAGILEDFLRARGIEVTEEEIDQELELREREFYADINDILDMGGYFDRKSAFGTIITGRLLPKPFLSYFSEIKSCFLFGHMKAVIGLCRVLLEVAFRDQFKRKGLAKKYGDQKVSILEDYRIKGIIREVSKDLKMRSLGDDACKLYDAASKILHGETQDTDENEEYVASFVKDTFAVIEKLYG